MTAEFLPTPRCASCAAPLTPYGCKECSATAWVANAKAKARAAEALPTPAPTPAPEPRYVPSMEAVMAAIRAFDAAEGTQHAEHPGSWTATFAEVLIAARRVEVRHAD